MRTEELIQAAARDIMAQIEDDGHGDHGHDHGDDSDAYHDEAEAARAADEGADSSSQQGSYDGGSESVKGTAALTISLSPQGRLGYRIFRSTPPTTTKTTSYRPLAATIDPLSEPPQIFEPCKWLRLLRAVYGSGTVVTSPRSANRKFPAVSRLGSPAGSVQYSPKNRTPSRFKVKQEAPLILLHATLLPLRWMWADIIDDLDSSEMSEDAKLLRDSWRLLQDCNDYEVLEERLLEALELPMRRRARILECGHYLGPANEKTIGEEEDSEDDYDAVRSQVKHHWCNTCKHEIRYESLGPGKIFRVKVYASNGLMKAGAWAACWKEMERVDVELEPVVPPAVQDELVRLAAAREEREAAKQREFDVVSNIVHQMEEEQRDQPCPQVDDRRAPRVRVFSWKVIGRARPESSYSRRPFAEERPESVYSRSPLAEERPGSVHSRKSLGEERRLREEARMREVYGSTPEPDYTPSEAPSTREPYPDSFASKPTSPSRPRDASYERKEPLASTSPVRLSARTSATVYSCAVARLQELQVRAYVPEVQHAELPQPMTFRQTQGTQAVEPVATYTPSMQVAASQEVPQNTPEVPETTPSYGDSAASGPCETPVAAQEPQPTLEHAVEQPQATPEVTEAKKEGQTENVKEEDEKEPGLEIVKEKKVVRVVETVTETETVKVTATATATHTDSEETQAATVEAVADEQSEAATQEGEPLDTPIAESVKETSEEEPAQPSQSAEPATSDEPAASDEPAELNESAEQEDSPTASEIRDE
ncbi:hypothetical protein PG994_002068 [Apiospora phragmitis]|uniref:Pathway-specific nitrogen regulator n=1 Tax=Apiospora phragmitis TaxID=2905665 RepID=A0ABR1WVC6_9PEZI